MFRITSRRLVLVSTFNLALLARNDNIFKNRQELNMYKHFYRRVTVRGIAKNPVDHPNGGRSNTKQPLKTP